METFLIADGGYPHSNALKAGEVATDKFALDFKEISPVNRAFAQGLPPRRREHDEIWR